MSNPLSSLPWNSILPKMASKSKPRRPFVTDPPPSPQQEQEQQQQQMSESESEDEEEEETQQSKSESEEEEEEKDEPLEQPKTPKPSKRKPEKSTDNGNTSKLKKKKKKIKPSIEEKDEVKNHSEKKLIANRLWSEEDEIAILKGLINFQTKIGKDPSFNQVEFYDSVKKSLHVDVNKTQLMDKVRKLKAKFSNNLAKSGNGQDPVLAKPHEFKCFQLSKQIWGNFYYVDNNFNANAVDVVTKDKIETYEDENEGNFAKLFPFLMDGISSTSHTGGFIYDMLNKNLKLVDGSNLKELESEWKEIYLMETQLAVKKLDLIRKQAKMVIDVMKSS